MHIPAVTFEIVTGLSKIKKKKSAATENCMYSSRWTQARARYQACLPQKWTVLEKLNLALFNIVFGVAFTMNQ